MKYALLRGSCKISISQLLVGVFLVSGSAYSQSTSPTLVPQQAPSKPSNPANSWQKIASGPATDDVPSSIRSQRDQYWDRITGYKERLTPQNAGRMVSFEGSIVGIPPEFPNVPLQAIVIATFTKSKAFLTASGRAVYTEITLNVSDIFRDALGGLRSGSDITDMVPGGTVASAQGNISFMTSPKHFFLQPGRTYLLMLDYHSMAIGTPRRIAGT